MNLYEFLENLNESPDTWWIAKGAFERITFTYYPQLDAIFSVKETGKPIEHFRINLILLQNSYLNNVILKIIDTYFSSFVKNMEYVIISNEEDLFRAIAECVYDKRTYRK